MVKIESNGSKWYGEQIERLAAHTLDPSFEDYGNFVFEPRNAQYLGRGEYADLGPQYPGQNVVRFWGNFADVSGVFHIDTDEPELIEKLTAAIRANQQTDAYQAARAAATLKRAA
jgi:hypothetical protein